MINSYCNYGGRMSRLCINLPLLVHCILLYIVYHVYYSLNLYNFYLLLCLIVLINIEWIIVIMYEYIYVYSINVNNNLLYNMILFIFLEIVLFVGVYWLYMNFVINGNNFPTFNPVSSYYLGINSSSPLTSSSSVMSNSDCIYGLVLSSSNSNLDICLYIVISNLIILLYVTLLLQYIHIYLSI